MKTIRILMVWLLCGLPVLASEFGPQVELEPVYFEVPAVAGTVQTSIAWGSIRVSEHDLDHVVVVAGATPGVRIEPFVRGNAVDVRVGVIEGFHGVDLELRVPPGTHVSLEVRRGGDIFVDDVSGPVEISNRNGSVELAGLGDSAVVNARNGSITATFDRVDPDAPMAFSTLNGSVDVTFPPEIAADLSVRYNRGGVESDFAIEDGTGRAADADVSGLDPRETRVLHGSIQGGGPRYHFETANGTVYLRRGG